MKNGIIKLFCIIMSFLTFVMLLSSNVNAANEKNIESQEIKKIIDEIRPMYLNDPMFLLEASDSGCTVEEFLELKAVKKYYSRIHIAEGKETTGGGVMGVGNYGNNLFANVPLIQQTTSSNCGPTAALQVIYGFAAANSVSGTTNAEKITTLTNEADAQGGTVLYKLVNAINLHAPSYGHYEYIMGSSLTQAQFQSKVETSLCYDLAPIFLARTEVLGYYNQHASGHYIAVSELDKINATITVKDCNYTNTYYGTHTEAISNFYNCIQDYSDGTPRYLICYDY